MSEVRLPIHQPLEKPLPSTVESSLVSRGRERLASLEGRADQIPAAELATWKILDGLLESLLRTQIRNAWLTDADFSLTPEQDNLALSLVHLVADERHWPPAKEFVEALDKAIGQIDRDRRYPWYESLALRLVRDVLHSGDGTGMAQTYANLNHHLSSLRLYVLRIAWLARPQLDWKVAAPRLLFNVDHAFGYWEDSLALLFSLCPDEKPFWTTIDSYVPEAHVEFYRECIDKLRRQDIELLEYLHKPKRLMMIELEVIRQERDTFNGLLEEFADESAQ